MNSHKPKPCHHCGKMPGINSEGTVWCSTESVVDCPFSQVACHIDVWNTRPIEDRLNAIIAAQDRLTKALDDWLWDLSIPESNTPYEVTDARAALDALRGEGNHE